MKKTLYSLVLNDEVVREVDALAHRMGTNRSNLINQILAEYVNYTTPEQRINEVLSAIEDVLQKILAHTGSVFGAVRRECGNYRNLNLEAAQLECQRYYDVLQAAKPISFEYK